jgi:hypothetical protein
VVGLPQGDGRAPRGPALLTALIIGSARTLADDERRARELFAPDLLIGCNHAARDHDGPVDHWATMHPDLYPIWLSLRRQAGRPEPGQLWHARHRIAPAGLRTRPIESWGGSSGMLCVAVAFELGVERIVLAGVPLDKMARHYDDDRPWQEARAYRQMWEMRVPMLTGRVKSMSGWTRDLLGEPTEDWLGDEHRSATPAP